MTTASETRTVSHCECGKRKSQYGPLCRACDKQHRERRVAEAQRVVNTGRCPQCGAGLCRNLSLAGWWQCDQFGAVGFRKDADKPACSFQAFTV